MSIHNIAEEPMQFPCWIWYEAGSEWHFIQDEFDDALSRGQPATGYWHDDTPTKPTVKPPYTYRQCDDAHHTMMNGPRIAQSLGLTRIPTDSQLIDFLAWEHGLDPKLYRRSVTAALKESASKNPLITLKVRL
jgi:hypothetical protein